MPRPLTTTPMPQALSTQARQTTPRRPLVFLVALRRPMLAARPRPSRPGASGRHQGAALAAAMAVAAGTCADMRREKSSWCKVPC